MRAVSHSSTKRAESSSSASTIKRYPLVVVSIRVPSDLRKRDTAVRMTEPSVRRSATCSAIRSVETLEPPAATSRPRSRRRCGVSETAVPESSQISIGPRIPNLTLLQPPIDKRAVPATAVTVASR